MLSALRAEEAIASATQVAAGSGQLKDYARQEVWAEWDRQAARAPMPVKPTAGARAKAPIDKSKITGVHGMKLTRVRGKSSRKA